MSTRRSMFIVLVLSWIAASVVPTRASCVESTLDTQFARSQAVFVGRAIDQRIVPDPLLVPDPESRVTETTFDVEQRWKGPATTTLRVQTCGWFALGKDQAMSCSVGFPFHVGVRYVVFASAIPGDDSLVTNTCVPTSAIDRAEATLQWLSGKPRK
jgi:hypothetical protein